MRDRTRRASWLLLCCCIGCLITPLGAQLAFDVASIRRSQSEAPGGRSGILPGGHFFAENNTLKQLVTVAYQLPLSRVVGGPDWVTSDRWDVTARSAEESKKTPLDVFVMLQQLLRDRFGLVVRKENRESDVFALVRVREGALGPSARRSEIKCDAASRARTPPSSPDARPVCSFRTSRGRIVAGGVAVLTLANILQRDAGRPVVDRTGIEGLLDFDLEWSAAPNEPGPSIFTAVQEQLGLKLEPVTIAEDVSDNRKGGTTHPELTPPSR